MKNTIAYFVAEFNYDHKSIIVQAPGETEQMFPIIIKDKCYKTFYARNLRMSESKLECLYLASLFNLKNLLLGAIC
jgi:hypothetical protein